MYVHNTSECRKYNNRICKSFDSFMCHPVLYNTLQPIKFDTKCCFFSSSRSDGGNQHLYPNQRKKCIPKTWSQPRTAWFRMFCVKLRIKLGYQMETWKRRNLSDSTGDYVNNQEQRYLYIYKFLCTSFNGVNWYRDRISGMYSVCKL